MTCLKWMSKLIPVITVVILLTAITVSAEDDYNPYGKPFKVRATCYTSSEGAITADNSKVREGIIAGKREWLGYGCVIYDLDMKIIGLYEFRDTGGHEELKNGTRIDVYRNSLQRCHEWIDTYGDYVYIQVFKVEG